MKPTKARQKRRASASPAPWKPALLAFGSTLAIGAAWVLLASLGAYFTPDPDRYIRPFALSAAALTAYQRGVFDITFIERPAESAETADTLPPETSAPVPADASSGLSDADGTDSSETVETGETGSDIPATDGVTDFLNSLGSTATALSGGWEVTDEVFSSRMKLTLLDPAVAVGSPFSLRSKESVEYTRVPNEKYGGYTTESSSVYVERPLVEVYMDYILVDNGSTVALLNREGNILDGSFDVEYYVPAYTRNSDDIAQFRVTVPAKSKYGSETYKYYMFDGDGDAAGQLFDYREVPVAVAVRWCVRAVCVPYCREYPVSFGSLFFTGSRKSGISGVQQARYQGIHGLYPAVRGR